MAQVAADGPAELAGVRSGDIITAIHRRAAGSAGKTMRELGPAQPGEPVFVLLWRRGVELFLQMRRE